MAKTIRHGTYGGYTNGGCRCDECRRALREYKRDYNARVRQGRPPRVLKSSLPCAINGCPKPVKARGWCQSHYWRFVRHGDPLAGGTFRKYKVGQPCRFAGCPDPAVGQGYCTKHVGRLRRGAPLDVEPAYRYISSNGYVLVIPDGTSKGRKHSGKRVPEHRLVMERHLGRPLLPSENVHHINGVRDDNRIENLELWSRSQPSGQRAVDKLAWAREVFALYGPLADAGLI